jgi:predicted nucleic acid-binding protein
VIVLDASVLIAHLDGRDALHEQATRLLGGLADEPFAAGVLTLAEVLVHPTRSGRQEVAERSLADLDLISIPVGADAPARLARLRVETSLKMPACCVLLAAADARARAIATFDERLAAQAAALDLRVWP